MLLPFTFFPLYLTWALEERFALLQGTPNLPQKPNHDAQIL